LIFDFQLISGCEASPIDEPGINSSRGSMITSGSAAWLRVERVDGYISDQDDVVVNKDLIGEGK
jgi:hypothetical protein